MRSAQELCGAPWKPTESENIWSAQQQWVGQQVALISHSQGKCHQCRSMDVGELRMLCCPKVPRSCQPPLIPEEITCTHQYTDNKTLSCNPSRIPLEAQSSHTTLWITAYSPPSLRSDLSGREQDGGNLESSIPWAVRMGQSLCSPQCRDCSYLGPFPSLCTHVTAR